MKTKTNTDFLELLSREEVKLEVFEFKSHTLGELLKATIIRNTINEIVNVISITRRNDREQLGSWEFQNASHDLHRQLDSFWR
tara:strand:+ start:1982 stop:2230 length:249 start_codon:yes stop_codon:yes gene_type:complete